MDLYCHKNHKQKLLRVENQRFSFKKSASALSSSSLAKRVRLHGLQVRSRGVSRVHHLKGRAKGGPRHPHRPRWCCHCCRGVWTPVVGTCHGWLWAPLQFSLLTPCPTGNALTQRLACKSLQYSDWLTIHRLQSIQRGCVYPLQSLCANWPNTRVGSPNLGHPTLDWCHLNLETTSQIWFRNVVNLKHCIVNTGGSKPEGQDE